MSKIKRILSSYQSLVRLLLVGVLVLFLIVFILFIAKMAPKITSSFFKGPAMLVNFLQSPEENLQYFSGRTNVLLLGISGGDHDGADLTDTVIFASIDIKNGDTVMVSIPRDIWLQDLQAKVNTAYYYGEEKQKGGGFSLARDSVYQITNQPINYTFLVDFQGFVKAIDLVGGIEMVVDKAFDDYQYPIPGKENDNCNADKELKCRYEHVHFNSGKQLMDGATALKFVRSRHAEGDEGTDFARSVRQQKVIAALKDKLISIQFWLSVQKWGELLNIFQTYVKANPTLSDKETASFANLMLRFVRQKSVIRTLALDQGTEESPGFLVSPAIEKYGQWVLVPRTGNWQEIQEYFKQKISGSF